MHVCSYSVSCSTLPKMTCCVPAALVRNLLELDILVDPPEGESTIMSLAPRYAHCLLYPVLRPGPGGALGGRTLSCQYFHVMPALDFMSYLT